MSSRDHHSSSNSRRHPPISGTSRVGLGRRSSVSSGSDRDRGVFRMSDSDHNSSRESSARPTRRLSMSGPSDVAGLARGVGNSLSSRDESRHSSSSRHQSSSGSSGSSGSWQPTVASRPAATGGSRFFGGDTSSSSSSSARPPSSRHTGNGSGSGSGSGGLFESRSGSRASATSIPVGTTGGRRAIINPASQFPGSGHSGHFKPGAEASTGRSYDSWNSDASVRDKYNRIKDGEQSWDARVSSYDRRLDDTPPDRGGRGESYDDIGKNLSKSQHERYGDKAHATLSSISRTANRRVEMNQDYSKEQLKKGLMTGHNTIRGHDTRVGILEREEDKWRGASEAHYSYAESSRRGQPSSELASARAARESRSPRPQPGAEPTAYDYGYRLRRERSANEAQLRAAGWDEDNGKYSRDAKRRDR